MAAAKPNTPRASNTLPLAAALHDSAPLALLLKRLHESRARFADIAHLLPAELCTQTRPGPLGDKHWSLLAGNGAVAAKLRQMVPSFEAALLSRGWQVTSIRIKVQSAVAPK